MNTNFIKKTFRGLWWDFQYFLQDNWIIIAAFILVIVLWVYIGQHAKTKEWLNTPVQKMTIGDIFFLILVGSGLFSRTIRIKRD